MTLSGGMPDFDLSALDLGVIAFFIIGTILIGWWSGRKTKDSDDFFLAGRGMVWPLVGFSLIVTNFSGTQFLGLAGAKLRHRHRRLELRMDGHPHPRGLRHVHPADLSAVQDHHGPGVSGEEIRPPVPARLLRLHGGDRHADRLRRRHVHPAPWCSACSSPTCP
ncbi:hypothetical protein [Nesterenkonia pannonica]|uniref:sodium:solute symporter family transporter n=1 Tax=Nesterenkonia pannonica TaxID=1548602 RepID=UPI002164C005|nr:hypothetical protein [Nesterenkonia pannonica]